MQEIYIIIRFKSQSKKTKYTTILRTGNACKIGMVDRKLYIYRS